MTARDEATVAREALIAKQIGRLRRESTILECDGRMNSARVLDEVVEVLAALESPAPAPRKVRARVECEFGRWELHHDAWMFVDNYGDPQDGGPMSRIEVGFMAERQSRADAEGMVEEGLGQRDPNSAGGGETKPSQPAPAPTSAPSCAGTAPPSDDLMPEPVSTEQLMTWGRSMGGGDTSHMIDDAPSRRCKGAPSDDPPASRVEDRPDAPSPQTGAEKDERMWLVWRDREGSQRASQLTAKASRDRSEAEWAHICPNESGHVRVVPKSRLDQAEREVADWKANAERENAMLVKCQEQRDALAKRVEEGVVMWRSRLGLYQMHEPDRFERQQYGPFTRGRFVADVAEEDFR